MEKALSIKGISNSSKNNFIELLAEQPDAINLLLVSKENQEKPVEMLSPLFGEKTIEFIETFRNIFNKLQVEINANKKRANAS